MNNKRYGSVETKVGAFFLCGLVVFGYVLFHVQDAGSLFSKQIILRARFTHAGGLRSGDAVTLSGLKVGEIQKIELLPDAADGRTVKVTMAIDRTYAVRQGAKASIIWGGLLGNRLIDIKQGSGEAMLNNSEIIDTRDSVELTAIFEKVDKASTSLQDILSGGGIGGEVSGAFSSFKDVMEKIKKGEGTIGKLVNSDEIYKDAQAIMADLKKASARINAIVGDNEGRITDIMKSLKTAVPKAEEAFAAIKELGEKVEKGDGILPALISDKKMKENLENALAKLSKSLNKIEEVANDLRDPEGKSTLARLMHDEKLGDDIASAVSDLKKVASRLEKGESSLGKLMGDSEMYDKVSKLLDDGRETLRRVKEQVPVGTFAGILMSAF
jgi:phospholipid/cholesterol/gamma-HCH transport system substrate-binding protein